MFDQQNNWTSHSEPDYSILRFLRRVQGRTDGRKIREKTFEGNILLDLQTVGHHHDIHSFLLHGNYPNNIGNILPPDQSNQQDVILE